MKTTHLTFLVCMNLLLLSGFVSVMHGQSTGDFQSFQSGAWNNVATWERYDGSSWVNPAPNFPTSADGAITIRTGHTVDVTASVTADQVTIESGATVSVDTLFTWTIADGPGTDLTVYGTIENKFNVTVVSGAQGHFAAGSVYRHRRNGTGLPLEATWDPASTVEVVGVTSSTGITMFNPARTYGNVTWNSPSQTATCNVQSSLQNIAGNLRVQNTGTGTFRMFSGGTGQILTISGDLILEAGAFQYGNGSNPSATLNIGGNYNQTGVTFNPNVGSSNIITINFTGTGKTFTQSGGSITNTSINWVVKTGASVTLNNSVALGNNRSYSTETGSTLSCGNSIISGGTGTSFSLASGSTLGIGSADGISSSGASGNIQTLTRTFSSSGNYIYNGAGAQITGTGLPATVNDLTFNNTAGITVSGATLVNGTFQTNGGAITASNLTFNGIARINPGGYFDSSPTYNSGSTLEYATGGTYGRYNEWTATSGPGYPHNVHLTNNTTLNYPNGSTAARGIGGNLTIDGGSALYMDYGSPGVNNPLTVAGNLVLAGNISLGDAIGGDLLLGGNWSNNGGTLYPNSRQVEFNGSSAQNIGGTSASSFAYARVNNSAGVSLAQDVLINNTLTLTTGNVTTGSNVLEIGSGGSISRTSGHIVGNLRKTMPSGASSRVFEVGDASVYAPIDVAASTTYGSAFGLTASTTAGDHPDIAGSGVDGSKSVNRSFSLTGSPTGNSDVTFNFDPSDIDGGANTANFIIAKYDAPNWTLPSVGTKTATSTQATGVASFSEFVVGEAAGASVPTVTTDAITGITSNSGTGGGNVTSDGGDAVTARGVVWNTTGTPTLADNFTTDGSGTGTFVSSLTGLSPSTMYYVRAYATNSVGTAYGNEETFSTTSAGTITSNGTGGGNWSSTSTWVGGVVPTTEDVVIATGDSVFITASQTCGNLTLQAAAVFALNGSGLSIPGSSWSFDAASTVYYNGTTTVFSAPAYGNLVYATSGSGLANGNLTINGNLTVTTNTLRGISDTTGTRTHTVAGNVVLGPGTSARLTAVNSGTASTASVTWNIGGNVSLTGNNAGNRLIWFESAGPHSGTATYNIDGNLSVGTNSVLEFRTSSGAIAFGTGILNLKGDLVNNGTARTMSSGTAGTWTFNLVGTAPQTLSGTGTINIASLSLLIDVNNATGVALGDPLTIPANTTLNLTSGLLTTTGVNLLTIGAGSLTGGSASSYVNGPLARTIPTGSPAPSFPIGQGGNYTPIDLSFTGVTTSGTLTAASIAGDHPQLATSNIDGSKSLNRYFDLNNTGTVFTSYDAVFTFVPGDVDGGANPVNFIAQKYDGSWSDLTEGTRTATTMQITGATSFSDFAMGEALPLPPSTIVSNGTGGGLWSSGTTWVGGVPPSDADSVLIVASDSVYVAADDTCSNLTVSAGGKLALFAKLVTQDVLLNGTLTVHADTLRNNGPMVVGSTGEYHHARNAGRVPTATWNSGSTIRITGVTTNQPASGNQNFHHVIWDCPAQTGNVNMGWNNITIGGDITVLNTNTGRWQMSAPLANDSAIVTIMGDVTQANGNFTMHGTGNANTVIRVHHYGNINVTGGNFSLTRGSQGNVAGSQATWYLYNGDFSMSNATTQNSNTVGYARFLFMKPGTQTLTLTNVTFGGGGMPTEVVTGTTLAAGTSQIRGSGAFTLNAGATLECGIAGGIDSTLAGTGTKTLSSGANFTFNGAVAQVTGTLLPATVNNLTVDNGDGVTLSGNVQVDGVLTFVEGVLSTGANQVTIAPAGSVARTSGHVNGNLERTVVVSAGAGDETWDIGDATEYTPVLVEGTSYAANFPLTISATATEHPDIAGSGLDATKSVNRFYTIDGTPTGPSDITFNFVPGDVDGGANTAAFEIGKYDSPTWSPVTVGTRTATSTQATGVTSFSDFAIGEASTPLVPDIGIADWAGASRPAAVDVRGRVIPEVSQRRGVVVNSIRLQNHIKGNAFATHDPNFEVVVENFGTAPVTTFDVGYDIDGLPETPVTVNTPLAPGDTTTVLLTWSTPTIGAHTFQAYTLLPGDADATNDSSGVIGFEVFGPEVVFHEGFNAFGFPPSGWKVVNADGSTHLTAPSWFRLEASGGPDNITPHEGTAYAAALWVGAGPTDEIDDWLISPNTGTVPVPSTVDSLSFWVRHYGSAGTFPDSLEISVSLTDTALASFTTILDYIRVPGGGTWHRFSYALPDGVDRYIAFRSLIFDAVTNSNLFGLDDVRITRYTLAPTFVADPTNINFSNTVVGDTSTSSIRVYNTGTLTLNITAVASDDANFEVDPTTGTIAAGDSADFTVRFIPLALGAASGNIVFTHDAATSPDTVTVSGTGVSTPVSTLFLSVPPETLYATVAGKFPKPVKRPKPGKPLTAAPNWANLMSEGVAQGGFGPGTVSSDSAGGLLVGVGHMFQSGPFKWKPVKDSAKVMGWVRVTKWDFKKSIGKSFNAIQKTLNDKGTVHTGGPRGFDLFANNKPFVKQLGKLAPKKQNNVMFAEMLALKFNIAMSALGKIPAGFGDLIYENTGNPFDQMSVIEIAQRGDSMMTYWGGYVQEDYDSLYATVAAINRAFVGAMDTVSFIAADSSFPLGKLVLAGVVDINDVPYLSLPSPFVATVTTPSSYEVESEEEMDFEDDEEFESQPIAAKLYQNYPNPFNPTTTLSFRLREDSRVSLKVYNMLGQEVASLLNNEELEEGVQVLQFNAAGLSSGIYFYRIQAEGLEDDGFKTVETGKMVLLK